MTYSPWEIAGVVMTVISLSVAIGFVFLFLADVVDNKQRPNRKIAELLLVDEFELDLAQSLAETEQGKRVLTNIVIKGFAHREDLRHLLEFEPKFGNKLTEILKRPGYPFYDIDWASLKEELMK